MGFSQLSLWSLKYEILFECLVANFLQFLMPLLSNMLLLNYHISTILNRRALLILSICLTFTIWDIISLPFSIVILIFCTAVDEKPPKVIVSSKTYESATLSFDHFAPEDYHHGYVALVSWPLLQPIIFQITINI